MSWEYFQTIESILKQGCTVILPFHFFLFPDYWVYFKAQIIDMLWGKGDTYFQTIESILKRGQLPPILSRVNKFPDYWVYFKAF